MLPFWGLATITAGIGGLPNPEASSNKFIEAESPAWRNTMCGPAIGMVSTNTDTVAVDVSPEASVMV